MKGVVQRSTGSWYRVLCDDGVSRDLRVAGKVRLHELNTTNPTAVGDEVTVSTRENGGEKMIEDISPRQNYIIRQSPKKRGTAYFGGQLRPGNSACNACTSSHIHRIY